VFCEIRRTAVPHSVLEAIKLGIWDYEPEQRDLGRYAATQALPGTDEKLEVMALRVRLGLPLWHPRDRQTFDNRDPFDD
jgi:hypothetical protein